MIDTEEKKYIADLCASVYGTKPNDVVPYQKEFSITVSTAYSMSDAVDFGAPIFIKGLLAKNSKKESGLLTLVALGVNSSTSKTVYSDDVKTCYCLARYAKVTSSKAGEVDLLLTGYRCIW